MRLLIDTHAILWFAAGSDRLSKRAADANNDLVVSSASLWEMAIKVQLGRLDVGQPFVDFVAELQRGVSFELLGIGVRHLTMLIDLPFHHRDPFDRLLAAQCLADGLSVVSVDPRFDAYGVSRVW